MPALFHKFRIFSSLIGEHRLAHIEAPTSPQEMHAEQVDQNLLKVDLPFDLENDINEKSKEKIQELNAALDALVKSVGPNPRRSRRKQRMKLPRRPRAGSPASRTASPQG